MAGPNGVRVLPPILGLLHDGQRQIVDDKYSFAQFGEQVCCGNVTDDVQGRDKGKRES